MPFLQAAAALLARKTGRALFSYPAPQLAELLGRAEQVGLVAKRLRLVHAREDKPARLALVELRAARPGGLVVEPPLIEWLGRRRSPSCCGSAVTEQPIESDRGRRADTQVIEAVERAATESAPAADRRAA